MMAFTCAASGLLQACVQRRLVITSEPSGAMVTVNDSEIGRTPVEADFTYYGSYDVLLRAEGYEPIRTSKRAWAPIYEYPPLDIPASMIPFGIDSKVRWHFILCPPPGSAENPAESEQNLIRRADELRARAAN